MSPRPSLYALLALAAIGCPASRPPVPLCPDGTAPRCAPDGRGTLECSLPSGDEVRRDCLPDEACEGGICKTMVCTPGLAFCDRGSSDACNATGTDERRVDCGRLGEVCVADAMGARCQKLACAAGVRSCSPDGTQVVKCDPDGLASELVQTCDDPDHRGNRCVNGVCVDRCQGAEAGARSTLGCRFLAAPLAVGPALSLLVENPQPDLSATIYVDGQPAGMIGAGQTGVLATAATAADGSILGAALAISSTVPVHAWQLADAALGPSGDGAALLPIPTLGALHFVAVDGAGGDELIAVAAPAPVTVKVTPAAPTRAGSKLPAVAAGTTFERDLAQGELLILVGEKPGLSGTRVEASGPVAVYAGTRGKSAHTEAPVLPFGALGKLHDAPAGRVTVVAREDATHVTTAMGSVTLTTGGVLHLNGPIRIASDHAVAVIVADRGLAAVPPEEQWLAASAIALPCACTVGVTARDAAFTLDGKALEATLVDGAFRWLAVAGLGPGAHAVAGSPAILYAADPRSPLALTGPFALGPINP